jgi:hypothetical protein
MKKIILFMAVFTLMATFVSAETTYLTTQKELYNFVQNYAGSNVNLNNDLKYMCDNAITKPGITVLKHIVTTDGITTRSRCVTMKTYSVSGVSYTVFSTLWDLKYSGETAPRTVNLAGCRYYAPPTGSGLVCSMLTAKLPLPA